MLAQRDPLERMLSSPEQPDGGSGADHGSADGGPINCDEDRDGWDSEPVAEETATISIEA